MSRVAERSPRHPTVGLAFLLLVTAYAFLEGTVMAIELPAIVAELGISPGTGDLAMTILIAVSAAVLIAVGRLADRYGRRRMCLAGIALGIVATVAIASARDGATLLAARAVQGVSTALILTSIALVKSLFPAEKRAAAFGAFGAAMGAGLAFAPLVGAAAIRAGSWRFAFWAWAPILALSYVGVRSTVPESVAERDTDAVDTPGTILLGGSILLALIALCEGSRWGWWEAAPATGLTGALFGEISLVPVLFAVAFLFGLGFAMLERQRGRHGRPVLMDPELLGVRSFRLGCAVSFSFVLGGYALQFLVPLVGAAELGLGEGQTGLVTALLGGGIVLGGVASGAPGDRVAARSLVLLGIALMIVATPALWLALESQRAVGFGACLTVVGIGYGLTYARITEVALSDVSPDQVGLASGMLVASRTVAMALGAAALTSIVLSGAPSRGGDVHGSHIPLALGLCVGGLALAFVVAGRLRSPTRSPTIPPQPRVQETAI